MPLQQIKIEKLTITGTIVELGEVLINGFRSPRIVIKDNYDNLIVLDVSKEDVLKLRHNLFDAVSVGFNAELSILPQSES